MFVTKEAFMDYNMEVWQTLYEEDFNSDRFLYHYTNFSKALKILCGKQLKFSKLNLMNDTMEAKPKIFFDDQTDSSAFKNIVQYFRHTNSQYLQLLCMSQDSKEKLTTDKKHVYYSDYSGRGFALPRMWAQYADNNNGVCFIFDKSKLVSKIKDTLDVGLIFDGDVRYISNFEQIDLNLMGVVDHVKKASGGTTLFRNIKEIDFLKRHKNFVDYNYFRKLKDWEHEQEYRFLAYGDEDYYIHDISEVIVGIVVGEAIDNINLKTIELLGENKFEIMKILFNCDGCNLKNINE